MYKLRRHVRVGPYRYTMERSHDVDDEDKQGEISFPQRKIRFAVSSLAHEIPDTLIHELVHAVDECWDTKLDESQVTRLGNGLVQALQDLGLLPEEMELAYESD